MKKKQQSATNMPKQKESKTTKPDVSTSGAGASTSDFAFGRMNYYLMFAGLAFILLGFILMIGGGSDDPDVFREDEIFSFRRITLAPILVLSGYVIEIFAILYKSKD